MRSPIIYLLLSLLLSSCNTSDDDASGSQCDDAVVLSSNQFDNANSAIFSLNSVSINGDCLVVNMSSGGCDGESWVFRLIDSEEVLESDPPQRSVRLVLTNNEACLAFITSEYTFDLTGIQVSGNTLVLNVINLNDSIIYNY